MIDRHLLQWPEEVRRALAGFEQGDAVEAMPFAYYGVGRFALWALTNTSTDKDLCELFPLAEEDCPPYGIITSQTCDLIEEDVERPCKPWFQLAPVYEVKEISDGNRERIVRDQIPYYVHLNGTRFEASLWIADLRIEIPVEKSWLVGKTPVPGFKTPLEREKFADRIAFFRNRPALPGIIAENIVKTIRRWFERKIAKYGAFLEARTIQEIRLRISGTLSSPVVQLVIILDDMQSEKIVHDCTEGCWESCRRKCKGLDLTICPNEYHTLKTINAHDYLQTKPIRLDHLVARPSTES